MGTKIEITDIEFFDGKEVDWDGELIGTIIPSRYNCELFNSIPLTQKQIDDISKNIYISKMAGYFVENSEEKGKLYISIILVDKDYSKLDKLGEEILKVL